MRSTFLSTLAVALAAATAVSSTPLPEREVSTSTLNIAKRATPLTRDGLLSEVTRLRYKYVRNLVNYQHNTGETNPLLNATSTSRLAHTKRATGTVSLQDVSNQLLWKGPFTAGSNTAQLDFDTGSSDTFFQPGKYNPGSTAKDTGRNFTVRYGDGTQATGEIYTDNISVGGLTATGQAIGQARQSTLDASSSDGISGMAFPSIAQFKADPFYVSLIKQGKLDKPQFGFGLYPQGARLDLGFFNSGSYKAPLKFTNVNKAQGFWQISGAKLNGASLGDNVIVDTGTTIVLGPPLQVAGICLAAGGVPLYQGGEVLCGYAIGTPKFTFNVAGLDVTLSEQSQLLTTQGFFKIAGIVGADIGLQNGWILGDTFLQNVYAGFDYSAGGANPRVGFALKK
ncbi:acid protease [Ceraceosorus guamensis]|uniref:Acid protease n=1 Tax=Ceraceosorus guamensis TaxID=1522189 RepID=A0A316W7X9_9BASI|nr:acid protease [Ceraceosorus guamensis]PWN45922.1 acid protease [Ceraceosorus guamensis]